MVAIRLIQSLAYLILALRRSILWPSHTSWQWCLIRSIYHGNYTSGFIENVYTYLWGAVGVMLIKIQSTITILSCLVLNSFRNVSTQMAAIRLVRSGGHFIHVAPRSCPITHHGQRLNPKLYWPSTSLVDWSSVEPHHGSSRSRSVPHIIVHDDYLIVMPHHTLSCMIVVTTLATSVFRSKRTAHLDLYRERAKCPWGEVS